MSVTPGDLAAAKAALRAGRWPEAAAAYSALAAETDDPGAHEGLAQATWWLDDSEATLSAREAAYRGFRAIGNDHGAVRAAAALGYDSMLFSMGVAVGRGWLTRAADLLDGRSDLVEAGWLAVRKAEVALGVDHNATDALDAATTAQRIGHGTADGDLAIVGQALAGLSLVRLGEVSAGMPLLDAAATAATAGDVEDLMWIGKICCWLITACQEAHDIDRATQWCARVEELCERQGLAPLFAVCRTLYASVLVAQGDYAEAEAKLVAVLSMLEGSRRVGRLDAVVQLGELRRRQGRLADAESLLRQGGFDTRAMTGLAQVKLAQGDAGRAWSIITELLRSVPAEQQLERVDPLGVAVAIGVATGHRDEAQDAARELRAIAERIRTDFLVGTACAAEARLSEPAVAVSHWQVAIRRLHAASLPFDEADSRIELAEVLLALGDRSGSREHATLALEALLPLQAGLAIDRARRLIHPDGPGPLTPRQAEVLCLIARGLTNAEVGEALHLSEHTVHRHIANIYSALDLRSRAAAAAYAVNRGLI
ncbi:MAG: LuxR C-terminal-related transcriptional regulator [Homoserinimonas sp.]